MKVTLESYSQRQNHRAGDTLLDDIAYFARVSNPTSQISGLNNPGLINYLIRHKHWSPFEMSHACLCIETTRAVSRQILRHGSFKYQEFSQRYAATETNTDRQEARLQDLKNRQNSLETDDDGLVQWWNDVQDSLINSTFNVYDEALKRGLAKEVARAVLPEGLTQTRLYMTGSIRSWIHYCELRSGPETQKEHREVARAAAKALLPVFPMIVDFVQ
mgnify:FL=1|tara:strand:- start:308 stop:958 length:651 start_codon:yes stop_codon:yes gene_type:complete